MRLPLVVILAVLVLLFSITVSHASLSLNYEYSNFNSQCGDLSPQQIQNAYGFNQLYLAGLNGNGEAIAIVVSNGDPSLLSDLKTFDSVYGLPQLTNGSNLFISYPEGIPSGSFTNWTQETALDVEVAHSLAPGAKIYLVVATNSNELLDAVNYTINNLPVGTISISWGASETDYDSSSINYYDNVFAEAENKGITIFAASGDSGAYNSLNTLNVNFPASSPYVIGVGGTVLSTDGSGDYLGENGWTDSGGGQSMFFSKPAFQPNTSSYRMVPDVAFNAGNPICAYSGGEWSGFRGTSIAAPSWAALDAIINQKIGTQLKGIVRPLYSVFYDYGTTDFNTIGSACNGYYCAGSGYNMVTGIGSPKAYALAETIAKTAYTITFMSNVSGATISVNGANYTTPFSLNFTFGEKINVITYNKIIDTTSRYAFDYYSGYLNSSSGMASFFVNGSGTLDTYLVRQFRIATFGYAVNKTNYTWLTNGSTYGLISQETYNFSSSEYVLNGLLVNNGQKMYSSVYNFTVSGPTNITLTWVRQPAVTITNNIQSSGQNIIVSYLTYTPYLPIPVKRSATAPNGTILYASQNTYVNVTPMPVYVNGYRYLAYNASEMNLANVNIIFRKQTQYNISFYSSSGLPVIPQSVLITNGNVSENFPGGSIWIFPQQSAFLDGVYINNLNVINGPLAINRNNQSFNLQITNVKVSAYIYFGIPLSFTNVTLTTNKGSVTNKTDFYGVTEFYSVPAAYNISLPYGGDVYSYSGLSGQSQTMIIYPFIDEIYLIAGLLGAFLFILALYEILRGKILLKPILKKKDKRA